MMDIKAVLWGLDGNFIAECACEPSEVKGLQCSVHNITIPDGIAPGVYVVEVGDQYRCNITIPDDVAPGIYVIEVADQYRCNRLRIGHGGVRVPEVKAMRIPKAGKTNGHTQEGT